MSRATVLTTIIAVMAGTGANAMEPAMPKEPPACEATASTSEAVRRTFFFAFPLYEMWRTRGLMLSRPGARINSLIHRRALSQPADRSITMPNVDTLYSTAWLDLADEPVRFAIPAMAGRYHSVELMHVFSDAFAILRNDSAETRHFLIAGPDWDGAAEPHETVIRSPTRDAWLVARTLVKGAADLAEAQRLQGEYIVAANAYALDEAEAPITARPDGSQFLAVVNAALARGPLPPEQAERFACLGQARALPGNTEAAPQIDRMMSAVFDRQLGSLFDATAKAFENSGSLRKGWRYPQPHIAQFGSDDLYRSAMALGGLAALPVSEAINPVAVHDASGAPLNGASRYRIRIPGNVPVDAFWSLTLYESDGAGRWFLYGNPFDRHAVNSVTKNFQPEADGTVVLHVSHAQGTYDNWLPAPQGRFLLVFRAYRPSPNFLDGTFYLPAIDRVDG